MTDEDDKRARETVLAEIERRKRLLRETEDRLADHPADAAEERSMPGARTLERLNRLCEPTISDRAAVRSIRPLPSPEPENVFEPPHRLSLDGTFRVTP